MAITKSFRFLEVETASLKELLTADKHNAWLKESGGLHHPNAINLWKYEGRRNKNVFSTLIPTQRTFFSKHFGWECFEIEKRHVKISFKDTAN